MVDRLQDVAIAIGDISILPVERNAVISAVLMPEAQRGVSRHRPELLIERAVSEWLVIVLLAKGVLLWVAACECGKSAACRLGVGDYRIVAVAVNYPGRKATGLESAVLDYPAIAGCRRRYRRWRCRRAGRRRRRRRRGRHTPRSLDYNHYGRAGLKEANRRIREVWRLVRIKPEVIQRAEANRVGVLILRKSFRAPGDRAWVLGNIPWSAAISSISLGAIMCPAGMLKRRMKSDVRDVDSGSKRHAERLDPAIEVLVIEIILVVPNSQRRIGDFVTHEPDAIVAWVRLNLIYCRAGPSHDGRLLSHGGACASKAKGLVDSGYGVPTVRSVVVHVALARMTLAPSVFVRDDVLCFGKIRRSQV